jgi:lysophospholipase L1-like esterase
MNVLVFGDSLADGLEEVVHERGGGGGGDSASYWGWSTEALLHGFPNLKYHLEQKSYDVVVLIGGSNDLANDSTPKFCIDNLMRMHRQCKQTKVVLTIGVTLLHDEFNQQYLERCKWVDVPVCHFLHEEMDTSLIDDDGIHLNAKGKKEFSFALRQTIKQHWWKRLLFSFGLKDHNLLTIAQNYIEDTII